MDEHELVWHYCKRRSLYRPSTNLKTLIVFLLLLVGVSFVVNAILIQLINQLCMDMTFLQSWFIIFISCLLLYYRKFLIILIELYQHYAPERIRRKCICMPTCSEYAIICVRKYNIFKALWRIYNRLAHECIGQIYHIDNP